MLVIFYKLLEKLMCSRLYKHLQLKDILYMKANLDVQHFLALIDVVDQALYG